MRNFKNKVSVLDLGTLKLAGKQQCIFSGNQTLEFLFQVLGIPSLLPVGPVCLLSDPIKDALHGFSMAWKTTFASVLHEEAKVGYS